MQIAHSLIWRNWQTNGQCMTGFMGKGKMQIVKRMYTKSKLLLLLKLRGIYMITEVCTVDAYVLKVIPITLRLSFSLGWLLFNCCYTSQNILTNLLGIIMKQFTRPTYSLVSIMHQHLFLSFLAPFLDNFSFSYFAHLSLLSKYSSCIMGLWVVTPEWYFR